MSNDFYNHNDGVPATLTRGASTLIRSEFDVVQAGFDKMPSAAQVWSGNENYATAAGPADAWTVSIAAAFLTSYVDGMRIRVNFPQTNATTTPAINLNALGAKTIVAQDGSPLSAGNIPSGVSVQLTYNAVSGHLHMEPGVGDLGNINLVAADKANIDAVAGDLANINAVAGNATNVNAVAGNASNINAVAGNATNVNAVAAISANVTTVAGDHTAITAVAADLANIDTAVANLTTMNQALLAAATAGVYPNTAASNVPRGLTQASVGAITAGSGGTNGTFALAWSGGNFLVNPTGTFTVAGGALTAVTITGPGLYIGSSPTAPTPSFAASAGLGGGAAVVLTAQFLVTSGQGYWVQSADGLWLDRYKNVSGVATSDTVNVASISTGAFKSIIETVGTTTVLTSRTNLGVPYIQTAYNGDSTKVAYLETVSFYVTLTSTPGYAAILVFELVSGIQYRVTKEWRVKLQNGLNTFNAPADFDLYKLPVNSRIGVKVLAGANNIDSRTETAANSSRIFLATDTETAPGSQQYLGGTPSFYTTDPTPPLFLPLLSYTTVHFDKLFGDDFTNGLPDLLAGNMTTKTRTAEVVRGKTSLNRTFFPGSSTPAGWTLAGGTVSNGVSFATPSTSAFARYNTNSSIDWGGASAKFTVTDNTTAKFGVGWSPQGGDPGGYVEIDATANTMAVMQWAGVGSTPASLSFLPGRVVAIPALVSGRSYTMRTRRRGLLNEIEWRDSVTQAATTITSPFSANTYDSFSGTAGFLHRAGSANGVTCTYFERYALFEKPKVIVLGDSNAWSGSIGVNFSQQKPLEWKLGWPYLLDAARGRGDVLNASRPGEISSGLAGRLALDLNLWSPDYVVLPMGTNDTVQATWRTNMQTVITAVLARGATPVMCTFPPRTSNQAFITLLNADILANFFGNYPILDIAFAVSASNDRVNWNTSFDVGDHVHMNVDGHAAVFNQLKMDCPFLLAD